MDTRQSAQAERNSAHKPNPFAYRKLVEQIDPENIGAEHVRRELLGKLLCMRGFWARWCTGPGRNRWKQEYRIIRDCFAIYDCTEWEACMVMEGWYRQHSLETTDADVKRVRGVYIPRAIKLTSQLRAKRQQREQVLRADRGVLKSVRESTWTWNQIQTLLSKGPMTSAEMILVLGLKPDTIYKTLSRHSNSLERVGGSYNLKALDTHWTLRPLEDKEEIKTKLNNNLTTTKGRSVQCDVQCPAVAEDHTDAGPESAEDTQTAPPTPGGASTLAGEKEDYATRSKETNLLLGCPPIPQPCLPPQEPNQGLFTVTQLKRMKGAGEGDE
jgi:hypothetical protein